MAVERAAYMGPRLRRLRRDLGLTQPGMAADLGVSVSYVSLLESNQRPLTADMLLRLARTYRIDVSDFAGDGGAEFTTRLQQALKDPLFADIDLPSLQAADIATNFPGITEAFLRLHTAYREEQLALAERASEPAAPSGSRSLSPLVDVRRFLRAHCNSFPVLDEAGEVLSGRVAEHRDLGRYLTAHHQRRVRLVPGEVIGGMVRRHDPHHGAIFLDESLDAAERGFQLALQVAYLELGDRLTMLLEGYPFESESGRRLARRALGDYAAAAILMPYRAFAAAAEEKRYDIEALARRFGTSFEQVAERLTTLQKPGEEGVPFFLLRVDEAGNVSKRLDGTGLSFAAHGGACPLWTVHRALRGGGEILTQWLELPDGQRYFSIARDVTRGGGRFGPPPAPRALALVCAADQAHRLIYAAAGAPPRDGMTPIGISCSLCQRDRCEARAAPPIGRQILPDDHHRGRVPFSLADDGG